MATNGKSSLRDVLRYGALGLPLAFVALPLVVQWPAYAASQWGLSLGVLGALLVSVRVADAFVDPWIGRRADVWFTTSKHHPLRALGIAALMLSAGFVSLFFVPSSLVARHQGSLTPLLAWSTGALLLTYLGYSLAQVVHQAWAARLGGDAVERSRWVGAREAFSLLGVLAASVLPTVVGWAVTACVLVLLLALGLLALRGLRQSPAGVSSGVPDPSADARTETHAFGPAQKAATAPWSVPGFRSLLGIYTLNGLAASIPASLVLFYVRDRIQAPAAYEAAVLAAYFCAAAVAVPLWVRAVARWGLVSTWALGMGLSIAAFVGAAFMGAGDTTGFLLICIASGLALGADLVVPAALLAGVIQQAGVQGQSEGRWFGWWSMATKLTLALAAGVALPLVQALGYQPGSRDPQALSALAWVYALLPCAIKALTLSALWLRRSDWPERPGTASPAASAAHRVSHPVSP